METKTLKQTKSEAVLKLASDKIFYLAATDGTETMLSSRDVFNFGVDPDFKNYGVDKSDVAKKKTRAQVYDLVLDASFAQMFGSFEKSLDKLCFTQHQIVNFCKKYPGILLDRNKANFFLFKSENQYYVARVNKKENSLFVFILNFERECICPADESFRVIVPMLNT